MSHESHCPVPRATERGEGAVCLCHTVEFASELARLRERGLEFGDCIKAFTEDPDDPYVVAARAIHHMDGQLEVDHATVRSDGVDGGEYVLAWVWVSDEDLAPPPCQVCKGEEADIFGDCPCRPAADDETDA